MRLIIDRDVRVLYTVGAQTAGRLHAAGIRTVRDVRERREDVVRILGKQGQWITRLAFGIDDRRVTPYRPQDAKSIGREVTFQKDVDNFELLKDVLLLLALCVEDRAKRIGLHGKGVSLKLTYADMKGITRSRSTPPCDRAVTIYEHAVSMLERVEKRPVRLIGTGIYNLSGEEERQLSFDDILEEAVRAREAELQRLLAGLQTRYHLDFAGHLPQIVRTDTLHKTIEYMRKHA